MKNIVKIFLALAVASLALGSTGGIAVAKSYKGKLTYEKKAEKGTHRIMTCNIRIAGLADDESKPGVRWDDRKELCRDVILKQKPDIICMQEVIYSSYEYMKDALKGYGHYGFVGPEMDPYTDGYHFIGKNVIFYKTSRYELVSTGCYWLSDDPVIGGSESWGTKRARHCNWVRLRDKKTGEEFRVLDVHLDHISEAARQEQAKMIVREAAQYAEDFPQIVCGDFNSGPKNVSAKTFKDAGWTDIYAHFDLPERFSYHAFKGETHKSKSNRRIDFIFSRGSVTPLKCKMLLDSVNGICPSDHYFLLADVRVE